MKIKLTNLHNNKLR